MTEDREREATDRTHEVDRYPTKRGEIRIIRARCKGCGLCAHSCPREVLEISELMNEKGYYIPEAVQSDRCTACRLCELLCPEFSIYIVEENGRG